MAHVLVQIRKKFKGGKICSCKDTEKNCKTMKN
jgi:hypothetical protein